MSPATRLAAGYFVYFCGVGLFTPFWSPFLAERRFSALEISWILATVSAVRAIGPLLTGWLADLHHPTRVLRLTTLVALLSFAILPANANLFAMLLFSALYSLSWHSLTPLFDVHTLACEGGATRYGRVRLWGSVGFIVASWLGGVVLARTGYAILPACIATFVALTLLATVLFRPLARTHDTAAKTARGFGIALRSRAAIVALLIAFLMAVSFGTYYVFFSLYLGLHGYGKPAIGLLWALGVAAEVVVFAAGSSMLSRCSIRQLFLTAALGTGARWVIVAWFVDIPLLLAGAQLLHCLGFAVLHFAMVLSAQRLFPGELRSRGQALFSSAGYGLGGMVGSLLAGVIWVGFSPRTSYVSAAFIVVLAAILAIVGLRGTALDTPSSAASA